MSGYKPVGGELLYSVTQAATNSTPTASTGSSATVGWPPITIPAGYFDTATGSWPAIALGAATAGNFITPQWGKLARRRSPPRPPGRSCTAASRTAPTRR